MKNNRRGCNSSPLMPLHNSSAKTSSFVPTIHFSNALAPCHDMAKMAEVIIYITNGHLLICDWLM